VRNTGRSALRLLHYWWPLAVGWSLTVVVHRATGRVIEPNGVAVLLCGIVAAYSLDRVLDPAAVLTERWMFRLLVAVGVLASLACGVAALRLPLQTSALVPVLGAAALRYPRLKTLPFTKTTALPLVWTWAAIALPCNDGSWFGWHAVLTPIAPPVFLLLASGCLLCDLKDEAGDRSAGVRSIPAMLGGGTAVRIAVGLALAAAGVALAEHRAGIALSAGALGAAALAPSLLATEVAGPLLVDVILTLPGILVSARVGW